MLEWSSLLIENYEPPTKIIGPGRMPRKNNDKKVLVRKIVAFVWTLTTLRFSKKFIRLLADPELGEDLN